MYFSAPFDALVVKASGLAAGKGVIVASTKEEACLAVDEILGTDKFGKAGNVVVIEEKLTGEEVSVLAFADENTVKVMLPAQDHKRIGNGDSGEKYIFNVMKMLLFHIDLISYRPKHRRNGGLLSVSFNLRRGSGNRCERSAIKYRERPSSRRNSI